MRGPDISERGKTVVYVYGGQHAPFQPRHPSQCMQQDRGIQSARVTDGYAPTARQMPGQAGGYGMYGIRGEISRRGLP